MALSGNSPIAETVFVEQVGGRVTGSSSDRDYKITRVLPPPWPLGGPLGLMFNEGTGGLSAGCLILSRRD